MKLAALKERSCLWALSGRVQCERTASWCPLAGAGETVQ
jgi:hypothetical protein